MNSKQSKSADSWEYTSMHNKVPAANSDHTQDNSCQKSRSDEQVAVSIKQVDRNGAGNPNDDQNMDDLMQMSTKMRTGVGNKRTMDQIVQENCLNQIDSCQNNIGFDRQGHLLKTANISRSKSNLMSDVSQIDDSKFSFTKKTFGGDGFRPAFGEGDEGGIHDYYSKKGPSKDINPNDLKRQKIGQGTGNEVGFLTTNLIGQETEDNLNGIQFDKVNLTAEQALKPQFSSVQSSNYSKEQIEAQRQSIENAKNLPIAKHRHEIIRKLENNRVLIISGDTGCGKTTQVPKYILEHEASQNREVNIICTQPRRLAASNIAKRVALELGEGVGHRVGYHVGMESRVTHRTQVIFMTTGIFLMRLVNNPESLEKYTHIIMDEVHERDLDIDFSLVVIKHLLGKILNSVRSASTQPGCLANLKFKLILMSATFNTDLFRHYFSRSSICDIEKKTVYEGASEKLTQADLELQQKIEREWGNHNNTQGQDLWSQNGPNEGHTARNQAQFVEDDDKDDEDLWVETKEDQKINQIPVDQADDPAELIEINARPFKVREFYLDFIVKNIRADAEKLKLTQQDKELLYEAIEFSHSNRPAIKEGVMRVASIVICQLIEKENTFKDDLNEEKKGVLVFLPGYHEIFQFIDYIKDFYSETWLSANLELIPLHSSLSQEEQDRAFRSTHFMKGKRKIIVATNIAESSITIPDIKYVIDFMLTKDVYYDPVSKSESLQLHYSSKASCKQRAGRAGRVQDGFVFRMCSESFFQNGIPEYPKPEMQRCPLEKLILQVKLWGHYSPEEILGRAIQPPEYRDICNAIKNLQETGALTIPPPETEKQKYFKQKITALGKIFVNLPCDIKITRLFLFGMAMKCMHQAIVIGCIHSQTRSIFRQNRSIDAVNMTKLQCNYDEGRDSDSLMLLKIYTEWQKKWKPFLSVKEDPNRLAGQGLDGYPRNFNKRLTLNCSHQEQKWCMEHSLDWKILKETACMVDEIKTRFLRMNIPEKQVNSRVKLDDENGDGELILKTCIGGAFYNKYIKAQYKNQDMINKMRTSETINNDEHHRAIILNKLSDFITEDHLRQFFNMKFKVPVQKIKMSIDKPIVIFGPEILSTGFIKACFKLGTRNRHSRYKRIEDDEFEKKNKFRSGIISDNRKLAQKVHFSYEEIKEKLECDELKRPNFLFELRFETINGENYVDFEIDSINNFTYELDPLNIKQVTFACQNYYDKGGRFLCRSGTRLPNVPMVDVLFCLMFAPLVQVMADDSKKYFKRVICDNGELVLNLTHVLTHHDLELIQKIREMFNQTLCNEDNIKQVHMIQIDTQMKQILNTQRLSIDIFQKLQTLREEDENDDRMQFLKLQKLQDKRGEEMDNFFLDEEDLDPTNKNNGFHQLDMDEDGVINDEEGFESFEKRQRREEIESEQGYFLKPLYVQRTDNKIYLYDNLVTSMRNEFRERLKKKRQIIQLIKHRCKEYSVRDVTLLCKQCNQELALLKTVKFVTDDLHHAKCAFGQLKRVEIEQVEKAVAGSPYFSKDNQDFCNLYVEGGIFQQMEEDDQKTETMSFKSVRTTDSKAKVARNVKLPENKFAFCECRNNHIVGIIKDNRYYFTDVSELQLMFPQGHYEDWCEEFWQNNYKKAFELQNRLNLNRAEYQKRRQQQSLIKIQYGGHEGAQNEVLTQEEQPVFCELCNKKFEDSQEFILHCEKDKSHKDLIDQFTDEIYDQIFEQLDKKAQQTDEYGLQKVETQSFV